MNLYNSLNQVILLTLALSHNFVREALAITIEEQVIIENVLHGFINQNDDNIAKFVRLSFHDCVGGCDGCLNVNNPDNNGLQPTVSLLENAYNGNQAISDVIGRADFWALAGVIGAQRGALEDGCQSSDLSCYPSITYRTGRIDCLTSPNTNDIESFPNLEGGMTEVERVLMTNMGMTLQDSVAIMGAHTLGRTRRRNSGVNGPWVRQQDRLDNAFYIQLQSTNNQWNQVQGILLN
eukprot:Awhi_evm1s3531